MQRLFIFFGPVAKTGADGRDEIKGRTGPDEPSCEILVRRMGPFGLRGRPPAGAEALAVGESPVAAAMIAAEDLSHGPSDLAEGEVALYSTADAVIRLWADGRITLDAGGTATIDVNGGAAPVGRVGDAVAVTIPAGSIVVPNPLPPPAPEFIVNVAPIVLSGTIIAGAPRFRG